jgi:hypothetical protein
MNTNTVPDYATLINHQIISQESLLEYHVTMEFLLDSFLDKSVLVYPLSPLQRFYAMLLRNKIAASKELSRDMLDRLLTVARLIDPPQNPPSGTTIH